MKKITLALLTVFGSIGSGFSQLNYNLVAPTDDNVVSSFRPLNGTSTSASQRSVMFIHKNELLPMSLSTINNVGFQYKEGTGTIPVVGNFTLYLQNTTDFDFNKPNSFSAIMATLTPANAAYIGTYTVPAAAGPSTVALTLTTPFNYTGGGLYVMWDFDSAGPYAAAQASLTSNNDRTDWHNFNSSSGATVNTFTTGVFRPSLIFDAVNTATTEVEVLSMETPGKTSMLETTSSDVSVNVVNSSIGALTNVTVALAATGANPLLTQTVIANFPAGTITNIVFPYSAPLLGISTISVGVLLNDQNLNNNSLVTTQSVTCGEVALAQPTAVPADYASLAVGNGIITSFLHETGTGTSSITAVNVVIPSFANAGNSGKNVYPVVADFLTGAIVATGNTLTIGASNMGNSQPLTFPTPVALSPNTSYLFGVGTTTSGYFPVGASQGNTVPGYYLLPIVGGTAPTPASYAHISLQATLLSADVAVSASASKTVVCKKDGPNTVTLTANTTGGLSTYTWTQNGNAAGSGTANVLVVTPAVSTATGYVVYNVTGSDAAGCKSNASSITVLVSGCTSIASNTSNGYDLKLFPNPAANGKSTITGLVGTNKVVVYNTLGQVVLTQIVSEDTMKLDLSSQPSGNYMVKISDSNNESRLIKMINQN